MKRIAIATLLILSSSTVFAQAEPAQDTVKFKRITRIDISEGDALEGVRQGPSIDVVIGGKRAKFGNMIRIRGDFRDKLVQSASTL